jgi:hypothetical protein
MITTRDWLHLVGFAALAVAASAGVVFTLMRIVDWFLA